MCDTTGYSQTSKFMGEFKLASYRFNITEPHVS
jgi:hypothetical protein